MNNFITVNDKYGYAVCKLSLIRIYVVCMIHETPFEPIPVNSNGNGNLLAFTSPALAVLAINELILRDL